MSDVPQALLLIDDDEGHNIAVRAIVRRLYPRMSVHTFSNPVEGCAFIMGKYSAEPMPAILLLNLRMPVLSGWQLLDILERSPVSLQSLTIFILTSSIDAEDESQASERSLVSGFWHKPLHIELLKEIIR